MDEYKGLNLKRESIDEFVKKFVEDNQLLLRQSILHDNKRKRLVIGKVGIDDSTIDLHLNNDGSTTVQFNLGKNKVIGEDLAKYLRSTIDPNEFINVNFSLKGISSENIEPIFDEIISSESGAGVKEFSLDALADDHVKKIVKIASLLHQDTITVSHFKTTNLLTIQGKPLFSYRRIIYLLSELLDLAGLQAVLSRTEENTASIVRTEVATDYVKMQMPDAYLNLPNMIQSLLVSGCCVKLASPRLPEYSMLLFPDLRALEGVIKGALSDYGMHTDGQEDGFGTFFTVSSGDAILKEAFATVVAKPQIVSALQNAYSFFRKHRHGLFHMSDFADASRKIDTLEKALSLSKDTYIIINNIFVAKKAV